VYYCTSYAGSNTVLF
nr:immunoglobulin light chain junction region [Macaca mulatta]MOW66353.1 immunoglobulin light chain junction region [Macaca mulatta]MOW66612.1 immunoglobulin light chain junction region [Macaca mulatta]MOW66657.1 immunoglobulin light chain junction region [Macaca mulatta]MOW66911.1 immunoglobulin light chain junction region [Macaca mulatta]